METIKIITNEKYLLYLFLILVIGIFFTLYNIFMNTQKLNRATKETIIYILMMLAEKYISTKGITKMKFCIDIIKTILNKINSIYKITIPSDNEIETELQKVFDKYQNEIQNIKTIAHHTSSNTMEKQIKDIMEVK